MKQVLDGFIFTIIVFLFVMTPQTQAQQQTGQVVPTVQNPQSSVGQPQQQQSNVQTTSSEELLREDHKIVLPEGAPISQPEASLSRQESLALWAIVVAAIASILIAVRARQVRRRGRGLKIGAPKPAPSASIKGEVLKPIMESESPIFKRKHKKSKSKRKRR